MSDLVKRLRMAKNAYPDLHNEAANVLEQKDKRISELEQLLDAPPTARAATQYAELVKLRAKLEAVDKLAEKLRRLCHER